jgi:hypothetical protein
LLDGCFGAKLKNDGKHKFEDMLDENIDYDSLLLFLLAEEDIDEEYFSLIAENENTFKQTNSPSHGYEKFNWNTADKLFCKVEFRFKKMTVPD